MCIKSFSTLLLLFILTESGCLFAQSIILPDNRIVEVAQNGQIKLLTDKKEVIHKSDLDDKLMHFFLLDNETLFVQTESKSVALSTSNLSIVYQLNIPFDVREQAYY